MSMNTRLQKAVQELSSLERINLVLKEMQEGRQPGPDLMRIDDPAQRRVFNRYMALLWAANYHLGAIAEMLEGSADAGEAAAFHYELLREAAGELEEQLGEPPARPLRNWRRKEKLSVPQFLRSVAEEARDEGVPLVIRRWEGLLALEAVAQGIATEFGAESVLVPPVVEKLDQVRERFRESATRLGVRSLPKAPREEDVESYQAMVSEAFTKLGLVEPFA